MSRESIYPVGYIFMKIAFRKEFDEKYPQCADCGYINEWTDWELYYNCTIKAYCLSCPKFDKERRAQYDANN